MTYSRLASASGKESPQCSSRQGAQIDHFIVHHAVNTSARSVVDMMTIPTKQVSANYVVGPDGPIGVVREEMRAWTSGASGDGGRGAAWDRRSITVETVNSTLAPNYGFASSTIEHLARLIADCATRYGFPIDRDHVIGHRELKERYNASYATACPGPSMDLDGLVRKALAYQNEKTPQPEGDEEMALTEQELEERFAALRSRTENTQAATERVEKRATNIENKLDAALRKLGITDDQFPPAVQ